MPRSLLVSARRVPALALTFALLGFGLANASPAQATVAAGAIDGAGVVTDDFGNEGTLSRTSYAKSNAVAVWQEILMSEGFLDIEDIDCQFGPATETATKKWQRRFGLDDDGIVGPQTWSKADNYLTLSHTTVGYEWIDYHSPYSVYYGSFQRTQSDHLYWVYVGEYGGAVAVRAFYKQMSEYC